MDNDIYLGLTEAIKRIFQGCSWLRSVRCAALSSCMCRVYFHQKCWRKVWITIVVGVLPKDASISSLMGSQLLEQQKESQLQRNNASPDQQKNFDRCVANSAIRLHRELTWLRSQLSDSQLSDGHLLSHPLPPQRDGSDPSELQPLEEQYPALQLHSVLEMQGWVIGSQITRLPGMLKNRCKVDVLAAFSNLFMSPRRLLSGQ